MTTAVQKTSFFLLIISLLLVGAAPLTAQSSNTGMVVGTVTDTTGAVIPQATVTLRDLTTDHVRTTSSNSEGRYSFVSVPPGAYEVKAAATGFAGAVARLQVEVGKSYTVDVSLKVGASAQTVEVVGSSAAAELQTMDASVGTTVSGNTLLMLPSQQRNVSSLLLLQPASMPQQPSTQNSRFGGQVAGSQTDQNTILLDGGNVTNGVSGNSDYYNNFNGGPEAPIATPVESIEEFKVSTNNPTASFSGAAGSQVMLVTKRGSNTYHGSAYWYLQNDDLNANTWDRNFRGQKRPESKDNRYGASFGGFIPRLSENARTYFYTNYEGRRRGEIRQVDRTVPTDTLRQGILRFRDATGSIVSYDLKTAAKCGSGGTSKCDPQGLGLNPTIAAIWSKLPPGNDPTNGDGLNTIGFSSAVNLPVSDDFGVIRLDHNFAKNWQAMASYRYFTENAATTRQVDIGGLLPGDVSGQPASTSPIPRQPRYLVLGLTGQLSSNLTNQLNFSYMRDWWKWITAGATPQLSGLGGALVINSTAAGSMMQPVNLDTGGTRQRTWRGHDYFWKDDLSWLKGNHLLGFGGSFTRHAVQFDRNDGQVSALNQYLYNVMAGGGINISSSFRPRACSTALTADCLPSNQNGSWNNLYASVLGMVDQATILAARDASLAALPLGSVLFADSRYNDYSFYINDAWHMRPTLTVNFGLNWSSMLPPVEINGRQAVMVDASGKLIKPWDLLQQRKQAALNGKVYNPVIGYEPFRKAGLDYPWNTDYGDFAPRVSAAWNPHFDSGVFGALFGNNKTVLRGGYAMLYDRLNGVQKVINGQQGYGFQQTLICQGPSKTGQCLGASGSDPNTAFRIGVNGNTVPVPPAAALSTLPLIPGNSAVAGANQPFAPSSFAMDPEYKPGRNHEFDFTIQREVTSTTIVEIGYIGHIANGIYSPFQLNQVPFFMVYGGQSFAAAYDAVGTALRAGTSAASIAKQPFLEAALAGNSICNAVASAPGNCTAGVASTFSSNFTSSQVFNLWNSLQSRFVFGPATASTNQVSNLFFWSGRGHSNYNAGFVAVHQRGWKGLTLDANLTYAHSLDNTGYAQDYDTTVPNAYDLSYGYGTSPFDRKFVFNVLGHWELPFGKGHGVVDKLTQGWSLSPIVSYYTGLPLKVLVGGGGQEFGATSAAAVGAVPTGSLNFGNSLHSGVNGDTTTNVATQGNTAKGGTGLNLFGDPVAVFKSFRAPLLSSDTHANIGGQLRGMSHANVDLTLARKIHFTERFSGTVSAQMFNLFNHAQFADPSVSLQSPSSFGVISSQINQPRAIELGLHLDW